MLLEGEIVHRANNSSRFLVEWVMYLAYYMVMLKYNVSEAKAKFSAVMEAVEAGEYVTLCKRNKVIATLVPCENPTKPTKHRTQIGWAKGQVKILGDLETPAIPETDWEMHQ